MSLEFTWCVMLRCDICGEYAQGFEDAYTIHFKGVDDPDLLAYFDDTSRWTRIGIAGHKCGGCLWREEQGPIEERTTQELLEEAIAAGRLPDIESVTPPAGSNADWDELLRGESVEEAVLRANPLNRANGHRRVPPLYECPSCYRVAPWTDGVVSADGKSDEFWCQVCGAESPLAQCREVASLAPKGETTADERSKG